MFRLLGRPDSNRCAQGRQICLAEFIEGFFTATELEISSYFLGIAISRGTHGLFLSQSVYSGRLSESSGMAYCKPVKSPLPKAHAFYEYKRPPTYKDKMTMEKKPYRSILGAIYYVLTRNSPDLAVDVSLLGKFNCDPRPDHWKMLRHVVRYLAGKNIYSLLIPNVSGTLLLEGGCDAD